MTEEISLPKGLSRAETYHALFPQLQALLSPETDLVANLANTAAALHEALGFFWVGFYFVKENELVLGPFQGPVACTRFPVSKGVCGAAVRQSETLIVPDVEAFPGHIACSARSRSEIVIPLKARGKVQLVLDIDSEYLNDFSNTDKEALEKVINLLAGLHYR